MSASTVLQNVLDGLPATGTPRDNRARTALRTALDVLNKDRTEQEAIEAAAPRHHFLRVVPTTPAAPIVYPPELGQGGPRWAL
jgi:hypothetical protein